MDTITLTFCKLTILNSCLFENPVQKTDEVQEFTRRFYMKLFYYANQPTLVPPYAKW